MRAFAKAGSSFAKLIANLATGPRLTDPIPDASLICAICGKPADLRTCKTDEYGRAVHDQCIADKLARLTPPSSHR